MNILPRYCTITEEKKSARVNYIFNSIPMTRFRVEYWIKSKLWIIYTQHKISESKPDHENSHKIANKSRYRFSILPDVF